MQLCKQTTLNPRMESTIKGWELMIYFLATFPPSKALKNFLTDYIEKVQSRGGSLFGEFSHFRFCRREVKLPFQ